MGKEQQKRVTFEQLIARKIQREKDRLKVKMIYVPCLDASMLFKRIPEDSVLSIMDEVEKASGAAEKIGALKKLIYLCCEDLQNTELHKELGVNDPFDTVDALFGLKDINAIEEELMELLDLGGTEKEIKNS